LPSLLVTYSSVPRSSILTRSLPRSLGSSSLLIQPVQYRSPVSSARPTYRYSGEPRFPICLGGFLFSASVNNTVVSFAIFYSPFIPVHTFVHCSRSPNMPSIQVKQIIGCFGGSLSAAISQHIYPIYSCHPNVKL
jgi:hypothetical protein